MPCTPFGSRWLCRSRYRVLRRFLFRPPPSQCAARRLGVSTLVCRTESPRYTTSGPTLLVRSRTWPPNILVGSGSPPLPQPLACLSRGRMILGPFSGVAPGPSRGHAYPHYTPFSLTWSSMLATSLPVSQSGGPVTSLPTVIRLSASFALRLYPQPQPRLSGYGAVVSLHAKVRLLCRLLTFYPVLCFLLT